MCLSLWNNFFFNVLKFIGFSNLFGFIVNGFFFFKIIFCNFFGKLLYGWFKLLENILIIDFGKFIVCLCFKIFCFVRWFWIINNVILLIIFDDGVIFIIFLNMLFIWWYIIFILLKWFFKLIVFVCCWRLLYCLFGILCIYIFVWGVFILFLNGV